MTARMACPCECLTGGRHQHCLLIAEFRCMPRAMMSSSLMSLRERQILAQVRHFKSMAASRGIRQSRGPMHRDFLQIAGPPAFNRSMMQPASAPHRAFWHAPATISRASWKVTTAGSAGLPAFLARTQNASASHKPRAARHACHLGRLRPTIWAVHPPCSWPPPRRSIF